LLSLSVTMGGVIPGEGCVQVYPAAGQDPGGRPRSRQVPPLREEEQPGIPSCHPLACLQVPRDGEYHPAVLPVPPDRARLPEGRLTFPFSSFSYFPFFFPVHLGQAMKCPLQFFLQCLQHSAMVSWLYAWARSLARNLRAFGPACRPASFSSSAS